MITDEQGREWLLRKFYDAGCRDIDVRYGKASFLIEKDGYVDTTLCVPAHILGLGDRSGYVDIAEKLGIVDWSKVAVDTPILVSGDNKEWFKRCFAEYKDGKVYCWLNGKTSWTAFGERSIGYWKYTKLAEV